MKLVQQLAQLIVPTDSRSACGPRILQAWGCETNLEQVCWLCPYCYGFGNRGIATAVCAAVDLRGLNHGCRFRRRMSCPVYEEEHLPHFPGARACARLPLPPPTRPAGHQVSEHTPYVSCLQSVWRAFLFAGHIRLMWHCFACAGWRAVHFTRGRMRTKLGCRECSAHRLIVTVCGAPVLCCDD